MNSGRTGPLSLQSIAARIDLGGTGMRMLPTTSFTPLASCWLLSMCGMMSFAPRNAIFRSRPT